jgi:FMN phosphatase YigB (HAD superfamily)
VVRRGARLFALVGALLVLSACQVDLGVNIDVEENGAGTVTASVELDDEALSRLGDLDGALRLEDLAATGWTVTPPRLSDPAADPDDADAAAYSIEVAKRFERPEDLQRVLDELTGAGSAFKNFQIVQTATRDETTMTLTGQGDLTRGVDTFTDAQLSGLLDAPPLGIEIATLEEQIGPLSEAVTMTVTARLPGGTQDTVMEIPLGESAEITAEVKQESLASRILRWAGYALLGLFGLATLLALAGWLLDRRFEDMPVPPKTPKPVRERLPVDADFAEADTGPGLRLVILGASDVVFSCVAAPIQWFAAFAKDRGSVATNQELAEVYRDATVGKLSSAEVWHRLGVRGVPDDLDAAFLTGFRLRPGVKDFIREMQRRELPIMVVANDLAAWSHRLRAIHGLQVVDHWVVSSEVGVRMPDPGFFEAARRQGNVPFARCLCILSERASLDVARSLGMLTSLLGERRPEGDEDPGHPVVTSFGDFFRRRRPAEPVAPQGRRRR